MTQVQHVTPGERIGVLDELRFLAALAVALFHFGFRGKTLSLTEMALPAWIPVLKYGYLSVQMFFVISGFVIAYSAEGRTPAQFAIARFAAFREGYTLRNLVLLALSVAVALYQSLEMTQWNRENYGVDYSDPKRDPCRPSSGRWRDRA